MSQGRVLVVDDEPDYRSLMRAHLERRGYDVVDAANGVEALEVLKNDDPYHVLVADLMMPEMDGLELLRLAKDHDPDLEVVVISGVGTLESAISSMRMGGAYDYLPKPLDSIADLSLAVERAAEHRRMRVERDRLQEQVAAERERLQVVIENTGDALISASADGSIILANPAAAELFQSDILEGSMASDVLPSPVRSLLVNWSEFQPQQRAVAEINWPNERIHMVSLTPIGSEQEEPGWVMILREITRIRQLQRMKMRLLAQATDGLKTPLADAFQALLELNELPEEADERFTGAVQRGINNLGSIRTWSDEVLALVALEAGSNEANEPARLDQLVKDVHSTLDEDLFEGKDLKLTIEISSNEGLTLDKDPALRLLQHLVRQAAWRSKVGDEIQLTLEEDDRQTWLKVHDAGPVLIKGDRPTLFDHFMANQSDELEGIALSLAMIKTTVDVLGGQLWIWSDQPEGNTMAVSFPHPVVKATA